MRKYMRRVATDPIRRRVGRVMFRGMLVGP